MRFILFRDSLSLTQQGYEKFNRPPKSFSERLFFYIEIPTSYLLHLTSYFLHLTSDLSPQPSPLSPSQRNIVVVVFRITRDILNHSDERWEVDALRLGHTFRLQKDEVVDGRVESINLEELSSPEG